MLTKFCNLFRPILTVNYRRLHKYTYAMDKAYLRFADTEEQFHITFQYVNKDLKVDRKFNFSRLSAETAGAFINRITSNIDKIILKKKNRKQAGEQLQNFSNVIVDLILNGRKVTSEVVCGDLFRNPDNKITLRILETEYDVIVNSPWVDNIALSSCCIVGFPIYPFNLKLACAVKELSDFKWYKSLDKVNWSLVGSGFYYLLKSQDINNYIKVVCLPKNRLNVGPEAEAISEGVVEANPGYCPFEARHKFTTENLRDTEFRVVSYNILADLYTDSDYSRTTLFPYCPTYALNMNYRKLLIVKELMGYNADIVCLQEVDQKIYKNDLEPVFDNFNYDSTFQLKGGSVMEGLACFYKRNRFRVLESNFVILGEEVAKNPIFSTIWKQIADNDIVKERLIGRTTVVQAVALQCLDNNNILLVANTHLYFHPDADHIRLLQGALAITYIADQMEKLKLKSGKSVSLVFCGDFNSVPECGIYKLYTMGSVPDDHFDWHSNALQVVTGVNLTQPLLLESACGTPDFTNYTAGFQACLDYIYYDKSRLKVIQVVPLPHQEEFIHYTALPNVVCPSDHLAIVADLQWLRDGVA